MRIGLHASRAIGLAAVAVVLAGGSTLKAQGLDQGRNMFGSATYYPGSGWNNQRYPGDGRKAFYSTRDGKSFFADRQGKDWHRWNGQGPRGWNGQGPRGLRRFFSGSGQSDHDQPGGFIRPERPDDRRTEPHWFGRLFHGEP
ncbi:MAG: hypothetical protein ABI353_02905 [Isosphaeraceae bacterium]